jgi:hypothetical protein
MRALKVTLLSALAAAALAAAPANAGPHFGHGGGHWHGGYWGGGYWGGPGLVFGLAGAAIAAGVAASAYCVSYVPVYDNWGNYVGRRPVNAC